MLYNLKCRITIICSIIILIGAGSHAQEIAGDDWPRQIETPKALIVIYQPQPEKLDGNLCTARAAVSLEFHNQKEPMFGAIWFTARLDTDHEERLAILSDLKITDVRIPLKEEKELARFRQLVADELPKWELPVSLDHLLASLETIATQNEMAAKIKHDPPRIIFTPEPAILVTIDGEPRLVNEEDSSLMRVVNTPFTILLVPEEKTYYLHADQKTWYKAADIRGEWQIATRVPALVAAHAPEADDQTTEVDIEEPEIPGPPPKIILATEASELISSAGKPQYTPIENTDLLYMSNTGSDVFLAIENQRYYVLLAGRWFSSISLNGPWQYVQNEQLPDDFATIPEDSEMATVLYAVPGTDAAREATLEAQIPQTARINREDTNLVVEYDGEPRFATISGTRMIYAINTPTPVIYVKRRYYACDKAVWFVSISPTGPWRVAESIPEEIYTIPPDNPLYNVTFVRIYSSTPEDVYIGYTPGYTHTYLCGPTIVYGTGYYYSGWYENWYCPRPLTWGFHARYNPWAGWRFGFSYSLSPYPFYFGRGWYRGGWWGPYRYRSYRHIYRRGYHKRHPTRHHHMVRPNLYRGRYKNKINSKTALDRLRRPRPKPVTRRPNNIYSDRRGNIHRKVGKHWEKRTRKGWQPEFPTGTQSRRTPLKPKRKKPLPHLKKHSPKASPPATRDLSKGHQPSRPKVSGPGHRPIKPKLKEPLPHLKKQSQRPSPPATRNLQRDRQPTRPKVSGPGHRPTEAKGLRSEQRKPQTSPDIQVNELERSYRSRQRGSQRNRSFQNNRRKSDSGVKQRHR